MSLSALMFLALLRVCQAQEAEPPVTLEVLWNARSANDVLNETERALLEAVSRGEVFDTGTEGYGDGQKQVRAELIRWLCTNPQARDRVSHQGVFVEGVTITGPLDVSFSMIEFPLFFQHCTFQQPVYCRNTSLLVLYIQHCKLRAFHGDGMRVTEGVFLRNKLQVEDGLRMLGASVGGNLVLVGSEIHAPDESPNAVTADGITVGRDVICDDATFRGALRLAAAKIGGDLRCQGTKLGPPHGEDEVAALAGSSLTARSVFLDQGFESKGAVVLNGARLDGVLDLRGGSILAIARTADEESGSALALRASRIRADAVYLGESKGKKSVLHGAVRLTNARLAADLDVEGLQHRWPAGEAPEDDQEPLFSAVGARIEGGIYLSKSAFDGTVSFSFSQATRGFSMVGVAMKERTLRLRATEFGVLQIDPEHPPGDLFLNGMSFSHLGDRPDVTVQNMIDWIAVQKEFNPQPYHVLASVLRGNGDESGAESVLIAMERAGGARSWLWRWFGELIGFGYRPWLLFWGAVIWVAVGAWVFHRGRGLITPTSSDAWIEEEGGSGRRLASWCPSFHAFFYSLDVFVPLLDLGQLSHWVPNDRKGSPVKWARGIRSGALLRYFSWLHVGLGWAITTMLVLGFSGLVKA